MPFDKIYAAAKADAHKPRGKYTILTTIAKKYTHNVGYPGTSNAAINEIFTTYLIPQMFARGRAGKDERAGRRQRREQADDRHLPQMEKEEEALGSCHCFRPLTRRTM